MCITVSTSCYKVQAQRLVYINVIHSMETNDIVTINDRTDKVIGGHDLDELYDRCMLPPTNPRSSGWPRVKRYESQKQYVKVGRWSKCGEVEHYKNKCRNPQVDFNANYKADVVFVENLFMEKLFVAQ